MSSGKKCVLTFCVSKLAFVKSSHICTYIHVHTCKRILQHALYPNLKCVSYSCAFHLSLSLLYIQYVLRMYIYVEIWKKILKRSTKKFNCVHQFSASVNDKWRLPYVLLYIISACFDAFIHTYPKRVCNA